MNEQHLTVDHALQLRADAFTGHLVRQGLPHLRGNSVDERG